MITCPKCSKENQDHYKFCLGCGAELPRDAGVKAFSAQTPPHGVRAIGAGGQAPPAGGASGVMAGPAPGAGPVGAPGPMAGPIGAPGPMGTGRPNSGLQATVAVSPLGAPGQPMPPQMSAMPPQVAAMPPQVAAMPPQVAAMPPQMTPMPPQAVLTAPSDGGIPVAGPQGGASAGSGCPQCGHVNAPTNKFCASCGYNLAISVPAPPQPAAAAGPGGSASSIPVGAPTAPQIVLTALRADGTEAGTFNLPSPTATVGRDAGGIFAGDSYLSPRHATMHSRGGRVYVKDELSLNGVYLKLAPQVPVELRSGDIFRIGQEIIRFEALQPPAPSPDGVERLGSPARGYIGRIALVTGRDTTGNAFPVPEHGLSIGRERGDILFPEDGYVSGLHCQLTWESGKTFLTDVGSSNGTFVRVLSEYEVHPQDILLMGQQLFRVAF